MDSNDITYAINGAVFEVTKVLGLGFLEKMRKAEIKGLHARVSQWRAGMVLDLPEGYHG